MANKDSFINAYRFLLDKEISQQPFSMDELREATGWGNSTAKTYRSKKLKRFLQQTDNGYYVEGIGTFNEEEFARLMSQTQHLSEDPLRPLLDVEVGSLILKSREAAICALDSHNRPKTLFRTECFTVMMVIAWHS